MIVDTLVQDDRERVVLDRSDDEDFIGVWEYAGARGGSVSVLFRIAPASGVRIGDWVAD
jgi:hypothetical protein